MSGGEESQLEALEQPYIAHGASTFQGHFTISTGHSVTIRNYINIQNITRQRRGIGPQRGVAERLFCVAAEERLTHLHRSRTPPLLLRDVGRTLTILFIDETRHDAWIIYFYLVSELINKCCCDTVFAGEIILLLDARDSCRYCKIFI